MKIQKPSTGAEKSTHTTVDTIMFSRAEIEGWRLPVFQRPLRVNENVRLLSEQIRNDGGVIPGILTFGIVKTDKYLIDGQMRRESFLLSGKEEGYADVRMCFFASEADMASEFINLNSHLVNMLPDDMLRGLEPSLPTLQAIRKACPFIGYGQIRRSESSPLLSMSAMIRTWSISFHDVPVSGGKSAKNIAKDLTDEDARQLIGFTSLAIKAWGRDQEYKRLWNSLNLVMCMWLYRRLVLDAYSAKTQKMSDDLFTKCLMSLSASEVHIDWLTGRHLGDNDRAPCYNRIKAIFAKRIQDETGKTPKLPAPAWSHA